MTPERRAEIAKKAAASRICLRALNPHLIDDNRNSRRHLVCRWSKVSCAKAEVSRQYPSAIMHMIMIMAMQEDIMGKFTLPRPLERRMMAS